MNRVIAGALSATVAVMVSASPAAAVTFVGSTSLDPLITTGGSGLRGSIDYVHALAGDTDPAGAFLKTFTFTFPEIGNGTVSLDTNFTLATQNIDFVKVLFNGTPMNLFSFEGGKLEYAGGSLGVPKGLNTLDVYFNAAGPGATFQGAVTYGAVPEPATWGLMILGIGFAGAAMRQRRKVTVRYA